MRNIIFDMDGTLLDSMEMWENLGTLFLAKKGVKPPENLKEIIENKTLDESAEYRRYFLLYTTNTIMNFR